MKTLLSLVKISGKLIFMLIGVGILYAYAMFQGGFVSWFLFYSFLPFITFSVLLAIYPFKAWKIERIVDQHTVYEAGDTAKISIQITRKLPFPLYFLMITDHTSESLGQSPKKLMLFPYFKRKIIAAYEIGHLSRGEHVFEEITVTSSDFLGFIKKECTYSIKNKVIVYPKKMRLKLFFLEKHIGEGTLARGLDFKKETLAPTGIREYQRGDRLSWINWKMTAKKSTLISKEFEKTEDHHYVICLDRSNKINHESFERIVQYSASLFDELNKIGYPVGVISMGADRNVFSVKKSMEWKNQIHYHLAVVQNDAPMPLFEVIGRETSVLPERGTIILVTDSISSETLEWIKGLAGSYRKIVAVHSSKEGDEKISKPFIRQNILIRAIDEDIALGTSEVKTV